MLRDMWDKFRGTSINPLALKRIQALALLQVMSGLALVPDDISASTVWGAVKGVRGLRIRV